MEVRRMKQKYVSKNERPDGSVRGGVWESSSRDRKDSENTRCKSNDNEALTDVQGKARGTHNKMYSSPRLAAATRAILALSSVCSEGNEKTSRQATEALLHALHRLARPIPLHSSLRSCFLPSTGGPVRHSHHQMKVRNDAIERSLVDYVCMPTSINWFHN